MGEVGEVGGGTNPADDGDLIVGSGDGLMGVCVDAGGDDGDVVVSRTGVGGDMIVTGDDVIHEGEEVKEFFGVTEKDAVIEIENDAGCQFGELFFEK